MITLTALTHPLLILSLLLTLCACRGQQGSSTESKNPTASIAGQLVSALHPKANLIYHDESGAYWFAAKETGLYRSDGEQLLRFTSTDGLASHRIISVQEDLEGNLYFDTPDGVSR